jgi:hypothetical protein
MPIKINAQAAAQLEEMAFEGYISELVEYSKEYYPGLLEDMGEARLRAALKVICDKAERSFGFTERGSIRLYLDLNWAYGWDFETDPQYTWVVETWQKNRELPQIEQAEILYEEEKEYRQAVRGAEYQAFLTRFLSLDIQALPVQETTFVADLLSILQDLRPSKYARIGEEALTRLIVKSQAKAAQEFGFQKPDHQALIVLIAFVVGHEFNHNPFFDWPDLGEIASRDFNEDAAAQTLETFVKEWFAVDLEENSNIDDMKGNENA